MALNSFVGFAAAEDSAATGCELPFHQRELTRTSPLAAFEYDSEIRTLNAAQTNTKAQGYIDDEDEVIQQKEEASKPKTRKVSEKRFKLKARQVTEDDFPTLVEDDNSELKVHIPVDVQYCRECKRFINNPHDLYEHMHKAHKTFICLYCLKKFMVKQKLLDHFRAVHERYANPNLWRRVDAQVSQG